MMSSTSNPLRRRDGSNDKQNFTVDWFSLPKRVRDGVIDKMDFETRCIFATTSSTCYKDAICSENYVYGIEIVERANQCFHLNIWHSKKKATYRITFTKKRNQTNVQYQAIPAPAVKNGFRWHPSWRKAPPKKYTRITTKWEKLENGTTDDVAVRYLKEYLNKFGSNIKLFRAKVHAFPFRKFNLLNAEKLEKLEVTMRHQANSLICQEFTNVEKLSNISGTVQLNHAPLRIHEIIKLDANRIQIFNDVSITSRELNAYLKLWYAGKVHKNMKMFHLKLSRHTHLQKDVVMDGLKAFEVSTYNGITTKFKLRNPVKSEEIAVIHFHYLSFFMTITTDLDEWVRKYRKEQGLPNLNFGAEEEDEEEEEEEEEDEKMDEQTLTKLMNIIHERESEQRSSHYNELDYFFDSDVEFDDQKFYDGDEDDYVSDY